MEWDSPSFTRQLGLYKPISCCGRDRSKERVRRRIQPNSAVSKRAPRTLDSPALSLPTHSHTCQGGGDRPTSQEEGAAAASLSMNHPPTLLQAGEPHYARAPPPGTTVPPPLPAPAPPSPSDRRRGSGWAVDALRTRGGPWSKLTGDTLPGPGAGARVEQWARCGAGARPGRAEGRSWCDGELGIRDGAHSQ